VRKLVKRRVTKLDKPVRPDKYQGYLDGHIDQRLKGWVQKIGEDDPVRLDIFLNDDLVHLDVLSNAERDDLVEGGIGSGRFGFQVPVDTTEYYGDVMVTVRVSGESQTILERSIYVLSAALEKTPLPSSENRYETLNSTADFKDYQQVNDISTVETDDGPKISAHVVIAPQPKPEYRVRFERLTETLLLGWAVELTSPSAIFNLDVFINGGWFYEVRNDAMRKDLQNRNMSAGLGGIKLDLPRGLLSTGEVVVALRLPNGELIEREFNVTCDAQLTLPSAPQLDTPVSIVVPVYNAVEDTEICIERLLTHTPAKPRLIIINDASPDKAVELLLERYAHLPQITVLTNDINLGFTKTVNRGMFEAGTDDVVFLNSDARVTPGWLEGLRAAAASDPLIGTVTPLSDRAGAFSAPRIGNDNQLPFGVSEEEYAISVRRHSLRLYPTVPTGNGFCMYVRRACIDQVGPLDEEAFPRGYGEENDFCMRARALGWRSVIDDATYVFHERSKSFGAQKTDLMAASRKTVNARHPDYSYAIKVFGESPQIALARYRAGLALTALERGGVCLPRALFVTATSSGGTPQTNRDLMLALSDSLEGWLLRCDSRFITLSRMAGDDFEVIESHTLREPVSATHHRSFEYDRVLSAWLTKYEFDLVHIRQLIWHSLSLPRLAKEAGAVVINSFHDFYTISPSVKLLDEDNLFCGARCPEGKVYVESDLWPKNSMPALGAGWIDIWQKQFSDALSVCDAFVTTSTSAREMILQTMPPEIADRFVVIPHGRDFPEMRQNVSWPSPEQSVRILVPGNISIAKGRAVIEGLLERDKLDQRLEFHILGDHDFAGPQRGLHFHGRYKRDDFAIRVAKIAPHVGAVFSIWDETYCHTLTEMWAAGLPVIGLEYPTVAGRIRAANGGWVYSEKDLDALYADMVHDMEDSHGFMDRLRAVIDWQRGEGRANTTRVMASKYQALYHALIRDKPSLGAPEVQTTEVREAIDHRVAVVCPTNEKLTLAPASTHVRVWARTYNHPDRVTNFVRMSPEELLSAVRTGSIEKAIIQRNVLPVSIWRNLKPLVEVGQLRYAMDLDDDLLNVPADKDTDGAYAAYAKTLDDIIRHAAVLTVSTKALATKLKKQNPRIELVPNLLSGRIWRGRLPERTKDDIMRGIYMGNRSHDSDFAMVQSAFDAAAKTHPNLRLRLVGALQEPLEQVPPWLEIVDIPRNVRNYPAFVVWLRTQCSDLDFGIAPLAEIPFNAHKSYLKALDYAGLGLPVLASNHTVYKPLKGPNHIILVGNTPEDWEAALDDQMKKSSPDAAARLAIRDWVSEHHELEGTISQYDALLREHLELE
jgi:GT2 family glycosyltransferase/glycosyltransferase involved in cell wall biosynthesis